METFSLHHDGREWNLMHTATMKITARYHCRRTALHESMSHTHGKRAMLPLLPESSQVG